MKQGSRYFDFKSRFLAIAYVSPLPLRKAFFVCIAQVTDDDEIKKLIIFLIFWKNALGVKLICATRIPLSKYRSIFACSSRSPSKVEELNLLVHGFVSIRQQH